MKRLILILSVMALIATPLSVFSQGNVDGLYVTDDGSFALFLPDGWFAEGNAEELFIATSAETLELIQDNSDEAPILDSGEVGIVVTPFPIEILEFLALEPTASPVEIVELLLADEEEVTLVGEIEEVEVNGLPAALVRVSDEVGDVVVVMHRLGPTVLGLTAIVAGDNAFDEVIEDVLAGLGEVNYSLPLEELYEDEANSVLYPTGWTADSDILEGALVITNVPEFFELEDAELQSNEVAYLLFEVTDIAAENNNDLEATAAAFAELFLSEGDEAGDPSTLVVNGREVAGLNVTNENEGQGEGGVGVSEGPDGEFYGLVYATADNEGQLIAWTGLQILLSINAEGIEG